MSFKGRQHHSGRKERMCVCSTTIHKRYTNPMDNAKTKTQRTIVICSMPA
jgi:hypothetical protein